MLRKLALAGLLGVLLVGCQSRRPAPEADLWERLTEAIDYERADKGIPAYAIAVVDDQEIVWSYGAGEADRTRGIEASGQTVYRVASVSKLFNALAVMQLVEQGKLDLDAPITDYLPDFQPTNDFGAAITLRQLLSHRSGLIRESPVGHYFDAEAPTLEATIESMKPTRVVYAPTTRTKYSNAAVSVAGRIIEMTQDTPYAEHLQEQVLGPMDMRSSGFAPRPALSENLGIGYMWTYDGRRFDAPVFELGIGPAANLYTTMEDLGRFMQVLFVGGQGPHGPVIQPETLEQMWTIQYAQPDQTSGFGLGFYVTTHGGERRVHHGGVMYGYATRFAALPDAKLGVALVGNLDATNVVTDRLANYALDLLLAHRDNRPLPDYPKTAPIPPEQQAALAGHYGGASTFELYEHRGDLYLFDGTERNRVRLRGDTLVVDGRLSAGDWALPQGDSLLGPNGSYHRLSPPRRPDAVDPAPADLVGEYGWDHNTLYLLERPDGLYALIEWFFYYPLTQQGPDLYAFPEYGLYHGETLRFRRNPQGRVTGVSMEGLVFPRRNVAPEEGNVFRITPIRPLAELKAEALAATPPPQASDLREPDLVEVAPLDPTFQLDVRYATANNFMGIPFYDEPKVFLQRPAAQALTRVQADLREHGLGLILHDGYRPWYVTKMFWDATPEDLRAFVANPDRGSRHNRGAAIDVGLYDLTTGAPVELPSGYDEFTNRARADYPGGTARQRWHRAVLREAMQRHGFQVLSAEWWHFDYEDWRQYPILNQRFEEIGG